MNDVRVKQTHGRRAIEHHETRNKAIGYWIHWPLLKHTVADAILLANRVSRIVLLQRIVAFACHDSDSLMSSQVQENSHEES